MRGNRLAIAVFAAIWASTAYFWHARDWNTASRLMLAYALVDRGTIAIDGFEGQTGDRARYEGHSYSDKLPGFSFLAALPYAALRWIAGLPPHPLGVPGFTHWPADYGVTFLTSGLATALIGAWLTRAALDLGCGPRRAALVGLAYGLATPAYAYGTLAYGHQVAAASLFGSFLLLWREPRRRIEVAWGLAGFLAAFASVVELQVGPVSAILGVYAGARGLGRIRSGMGGGVAGVAWFAAGAAIPTLLLLGYHWVAFDSPFRMGYFFHATERFSRVHSAANPLGLGKPDLGRLLDLSIRPARGLLWYAPIVVLAPPGLVVLASRRLWGMATVVAATCLAVIAINLSYPEWTGGWSTGPRLLVPMLPFAMLAVAALLALGGRGVATLAAFLALIGGGINLLFQGVGARVPDPPDVMPPGIARPLDRPLFDAVMPIWHGSPLPGWSFGRRFDRNLASVIAPGWVASLPADRAWLQFAPLVAAQALAIGVLTAMAPRWLRRPTPPTGLAGTVGAGDPPPSRPAPA